MNRQQPGRRLTPAHHQRYSRWRRSEITFGPVGRLVVALLLLIPVWFGIFYSVFFIVAAAIWGFWIVPLAYRDVWRRVRASPTAADEVASDYRRAFPDEGPPRIDIGTREMPPRW